MQEEKTDRKPYGLILVEKTLALIKPNAFHRAEEIEDIVLKSGFVILQKRKLQLTPEQCTDFYADQKETSSFHRLTVFMSSGPIVALTLARHNAVAHWRSIIGPADPIEARETQPGCLRAQYGTCVVRNALHGSESSRAAEREIKFMFSNSVVNIPTSTEDNEEYLQTFVYPTLKRGLMELCKHKPLNPCTWLADWLMGNEPNGPKIETPMEKET